MTTYRVATGHDVVLGSLTVLDPEPSEQHGGGIQYTQLSYSASGVVSKQGAYFPFRWERLTATEYDTILTDFGLDAADYADVTVYVRDTDLATWVRKNGVAQRPMPGEMVSWDIHARDVTIIVRNLEDAS